MTTLPLLLELVNLPQTGIQSNIQGRSGDFPKKESCSLKERIFTCFCNLNIVSCLLKKGLQEEGGGGGIRGKGSKPIRDIPLSQKGFLIEFSLDPLSQNIFTNILPTFFHSFPMEMTRRICLTIDSSFSWQLLPLITSMFNSRTS